MRLQARAPHEVARAGVSSAAFSFPEDSIGARISHVLDKSQAQAAPTRPVETHFSSERLTHGFRKGTPKRRASCFSVSIG